MVSFAEACLGGGKVLDHPVVVVVVNLYFRKLMRKQITLHLSPLNFRAP